MNNHPQFDAHKYGADYFDGYYLNDPKRDAMYKAEYRRIMDHFPHGGRVMDIGCGVGNFLALFDDRWEKHGIEPSEYAAEKAQRKGIKVWGGLTPIETETFDLVILRGTLQHIAFPFQMLGQAGRIVRKGGMIIFLATPNADSLVYQIWGNLPALDAPRNWMVIGVRALSNIMQRLGFRTHVIFPYLGTPYAQPLPDLGRFILSLFFGYRKFAFPRNMFEMYCTKE